MSVELIALLHTEKDKTVYNIAGDKYTMRLLQPTVCPEVV